MKKISKLLNSPITWKQSFIAAVIGMILSLIYLVIQFGLWTKKNQANLLRKRNTNN